MAPAFLLVPSWVLWVLGFGLLILSQDVWMFGMSLCSCIVLYWWYWLQYFLTLSPVLHTFSPLVSLLLMLFFVGGFCLFIHQVFHLYHFSFKFLISLPCFSHIADVLIHIAFFLFLFYFEIHLFYVNVLPACIYVDHVRAWCLQRSEEDAHFPGSRVVDPC